MFEKYLLQLKSTTFDFLWWVLRYTRHYQASLLHVFVVVSNDSWLIDTDPLFLFPVISLNCVYWCGIIKICTHVHSKILTSLSEKQVKCPRCSILNCLSHEMGQPDVLLILSVPVAFKPISFSF